ncbi:sterile alpha motif domain-containing protein 12-like [Amphiura filiformis]|uniref:sterile alpha motif domain-containing protein 12-like n=1 Tax=Amphiura filiformis TaxID=82378 RepID=UPI003B212F5F
MYGPAGQYRTRTASNISGRSEDLDIDFNENEQGFGPSGRVKKLRRPLHAWTKDDVTKWLRVYHNRYFQLYEEIFEHHELTGRALLRMNSSKLERIGIADPDHREDLLYQIFRLQIKHQMKLLQKLQIQDNDPE